MHPGVLPSPKGLYDPSNEHDACGVGFVAHIKGEKSHSIIQQGLTILQRLHHRGAVGADPLAGDGAGLLMQISDGFFRQAVDFKLPEEGSYGIGMLFMPQDDAAREAIEKKVEQIVVEEGQHVLGWRTVPVDNSGLGKTVYPTEPRIRQVFIAKGNTISDQTALERKLFIIHKRITVAVSDMAGADYFYINSMSTRTIVYKGMLLAGQVGEYYPDLSNKNMVSALALVHQRFSTNTFPTWDLAHPFRMIAHNGEINTNQGNVNWMAARQYSMASDILGDDLNKIWPLIPAGQSDSACFDNALELLVAGGYSMTHAMMMLIPEAWGGNDLMDSKRRDFYEYHAALMEPWDGPAAVAFTDGRQIGATLDRNGLRPARYLITDDDLVVLASEMGVLEIPEDKIVKKWRLQPGKMFLIDMEEGRIIDDKELKDKLASEKPYAKWLEKTQIHVSKLNDRSDKNTIPEPLKDEALLNAQQAFGYTQEDMKYIVVPMIRKAEEDLGSMGADNPQAVLSNRSRHLSNYFKQNFAQVTNPPIDPIREEIVMSLISLVGPKPNLLGINEAGSQKRLEVAQPVLSNQELDKIRHITDEVGDDFRTKTLDMTYDVSLGAEGMEAVIEAICDEAVKAIEGHYNILILSDRNMSKGRLTIPSLLATSAVHQHLIRKGLRTKTGLVVETASAVENHHFATLAGYGAEAINPWLVFDTLASNLDHLAPELSIETAKKNYIKAVGKGLKKVMSKMGICTYQSYCGAQIFDAVGLKETFIDKYFTGTSTKVEGIGLEEISKEAQILHDRAYGDHDIYQHHLDVGGDYAFRVRGEAHAWTPATISKLQHAVRGKDAKSYREFTQIINEQNKALLNFRGLMEFKWADTPVSIDEVEPAKEIVKRFATGAMSFGSISYEAHSTLAKAMNFLGGKSNTGEGGEEPERFNPLPDGTPNPERSAIKQVASGRFGVTTEYLVNADDIQIKMAQGAKPGEGGQLPGYKVNEQIGRVRHSTPGVGLISPPPHHDIYSIEDLAQLIHDLKNVNPKSRVSVKLVSEVGVGTVAAGVSKAHADHLTISGYDGGTGASPLTSLKHAGSSWELGLAETHQTLVMNRLRSRICVQADGGMRTGRDVVIAALLGADEIGFATAPLIAEGCIMMRKCHLNTCPVGVATQDPELRKLFTGQAEHVVNYFFFIAEEVRELMSKLGFCTFDEMIGQSDRLHMRDAIDHWKAKGLDYSKILYKPESAPEDPVYCVDKQDHGLEKALDNQLIKEAQPAIDNGENVEIDIKIENSNRTFGTMLSGRVAEKYGHAGLPDDTILVNATGTAGQSFGAWLAKGITIKLSGEGNDYVGKGLSGGKISIAPTADSSLQRAEDNIIVGNTVLYGAIAGECYFRGVGGERFAVRNSGATAVIEGVGDHGCEYMTGGIVVCLGRTGRNFAAGMSGGMAYVYDEDGQFEARCNKEMVELESIQADADDVDVSDLTMADDTRLKAIIKKHLQYTGSVVAQQMLDNWEATLKKFIKVMPVDYRRALEGMKQKKIAA